MRKNSKKVIGLDVGDIRSHICELDGQSGETIKRTKLSTEKAVLFKYFSELEKSLIILEVGTHSPWISRLLKSLGHEVIVSNARELRLIYGSKRKNDRVDAEKLARLGRLDKDLICEVKHRSAEKQADLTVVKARASLLKVRQQLVNQIRGVLKSFGIKPPKSYPAGFHKKILAYIPIELGPALLPLVKSLKAVVEQIKTLDKQIIRLCETNYPETKLLTNIRGVGKLIALTFVLTLADPTRFKSSRAVGAYLGLIPGQNQSGNANPKQSITKQGDQLLRRYLVQAANYIMGHFGEDCDLRRFALAKLETTQNRKKVLIAISRKLAILMHFLWYTGTVYDPFYQSKRGQLEKNIQSEEFSMAA